jgi:hypothetical protein
VQHGVDDGLRGQFPLVIGVDSGRSPVRRYLPKLIDLVRTGKTSPGKVFDLILPLDMVAKGSLTVA